MSMGDTPWGAEEIIMTTEVGIEGSYGDLCVRKVEIDTDEMTSFHRHRNKNEIIFLEEGLVEIRKEDDYVELVEGEAHFLEPGEVHQIQNIGGNVARIIEVGFPFDVDDIERIEDPYSNAS